MLSVAASGERRVESRRGSRTSASLAECAFRSKRPDLSNGGLQLAFAEDGMRSFTPQLTSPACKAATLGVARGGAPLDPRKIIVKLHVNGGKPRRSGSGGRQFASAAQCGRRNGPS